MAASTEKIVIQIQVKGQKDLDRLSKKTGQATKGVGGLTAGFGKMALGIGAAVMAFRKISQVIASSINTWKDYEFQMAKVRAITGASDRDFKRLGDTAQELGRSTFFTATQVAKLQTNYGKLGFTTKEILAAQEATLLLATATDTDLARAAIVAGATVRGFGLNASETGRVADVMAKAFTSSALDIEKFQTSMTKVAPIAAAANISLEATTAVMGTLTDAGIEASIAGTSLRNIFLKMQDPASDLSKHLGFTVKSSDDLERALQQLNAEGLSNAEMMQLVDLRQVAAFQTMVNGSERISHLTNQFDLANGSAKEMADIVGDTLEGAFKRLQSASEGLQIALMSGGKGGFMAHFTGQLAKMMNTITDSINPQKTQLDVLQETTQAMDDQFTLLTQGNLSQEARVLIIQDLNTEYGDYLPNLLSEKTDLEGIRDMQIEVNNLMMERIVAMAMEEELAELAKAQSKAIKGQVNSNIDLAEGKRDLLILDANTLAAAKLKDDMAKASMILNKDVIDNAEEDKETLIEGYKETAKQLGLSFKNIMASLTAARKAKKKFGVNRISELTGYSHRSIQGLFNWIGIFQEMTNQISNDMIENIVEYGADRYYVYLNVPEKDQIFKRRIIVNGATLMNQKLFYEAAMSQARAWLPRQKAKDFETMMVAKFNAREKSKDYVKEAEDDYKFKRMFLDYLDTKGVYTTEENI
jgi:TP901 family phage tail tape measure protein